MRQSLLPDGNISPDKRHTGADGSAIAMFF